mmetsp:Transcript_183/g.310  ORF Transcript_183/g.310 Transcript_183/m.310 type:complete len:394 (+) Transcript_183:3-1184(+)
MAEMEGEKAALLTELSAAQGRESLVAMGQDSGPEEEAMSRSQSYQESPTTAPTGAGPRGEVARLTAQLATVDANQRLMRLEHEARRREEALACARTSQAAVADRVTAESDLAHATQQLAEARAQARLAALQQEMHAHEEALACVNSSEAGAEADTPHAALEHARAEATLLRQSMQHMAGPVLDMDELRQKCDSKVSALEARLQQSQQEVASVVVQCEQRVAEANMEVERLRAHVATLESADVSSPLPVSKSAAAESLGAQLADQQAHMEQLSGENAALKRQLEIEIRRARDAETMLRSEVKSKRPTTQGVTAFSSNKKYEDEAYDIESAMMSGGVRFHPLEGAMKTCFMPFRGKLVLDFARTLDKISVALDRRPYLRAMMAIYFMFLHLLVFL